MGKFDHRSRDQKRKAKLKKQAARSGKHESLAYHGHKYKTEAYVALIHRTEIGIYESYVLRDRTLTDGDVETALEQLILRLRQGALPSPEESVPGETTGEEPENLITWNIRRNWRIYAEQQPLPKREDVIGVLRTILGSLETWRSQKMHSRGYLHFLEDFMRQTGVMVRKLEPGDERLSAPEDDPLL